MAVPLLGSAARKFEDGPASRAYADAVERRKNIDAARADVNRVTMPFGTKPEAPRTSSGIGQLLAGAYDDTDSEPVKVNKADLSSLHWRAKARADKLSHNAARLLDLMCKTDDVHRGALLIQAPVSDIADALGIKRDEADAARQELEMRDLISFFDNGSGDRGFRVRA